MSARRERVSLSVDEPSIIEDALYYYRVSTEMGGPDDYKPADIKSVERRIGRYIVTTERLTPTVESTTLRVERKGP